MNKERRERWVAAVLLLCTALVAFWQVTARLASRPIDALRVGAADFDGFRPTAPPWAIRRVHVKSTPVEPTILAYEARYGTTTDPLRRAPVLVRLVHGYNMVDCMRIKQYRVDLLADRRHDRGGGMPLQIWRITSADGHRSLWVTSMLRAVDFTATGTDTRDMAFPRVGTPDDPAWAPSGLKWASFRNPVRNSRYFLRSKWNASRSDLLTFLRLRQPVWASDVLLTMVSEYRGRSLTDEEEAGARAHVLDAHALFIRFFEEHGRDRVSGD